MVKESISTAVLQLAWFNSQFILALCCLCFTGVTMQDGKIKCSVPSVLPFQDTIMTCHFPEDVSVTKKDFTVYHYIKHGSPEAVLDCWWVHGLLDCYTKPGIKYNRTVSQTLTLTVRNVTTASEGKYACQAAGYGSTSVEACEFNLKIGNNTTCSIFQDGSYDKATLTCFFDEDIHETQRNFSVYKYNGQQKLGVVKCLWENGKHNCHIEDGYQYSGEVHSYLRMAIPKPGHKQPDIYSCWHDGSEADQMNSCSLDTKEAEEIEGCVEGCEKVSVAVGVSCGVVVVLALSSGLIFYLRRKRRGKNGKNRKECEFLIEVEENCDQVSKTYQENLTKMYPNLLSTPYFVPPAHFYKLRYKTESVAGQVVYIPDPPDQNCVRHDQAKQHIFHCIRQMAEKKEEHMFVLTQFKYDDYLSNRKPAYEQKHLPVFSDTVREDNTECCDFLIIHRNYGVHVGVVKSLSDKDDCSPDGERKTDELLAAAVSEAIEQLKMADRKIQCLLSDKEKEKISTVKLTLMLPNVTMSSLRRALGSHNKVARNFLECMKEKNIEDVIQLCLCADYLSNPCSAWDVDSTMMDHLTRWWDLLMKSLGDGPTMTDDIYQTIIYRLCGPATVSDFEISGESTCQLPRTLQMAVLITGEFFEKFTVFPGMTEMLEEPRMILSGPPGTGKSKTLVLVGRKWISEGHVVCLINTWEEGSVANMQLLNLLRQTPAVQSSANPKQKAVISIFCNIENKNEIDEAVTFLKKHAKGQPLFALVDEPTFDKTKSEQVAAFLQKLHENLSDLHMWVASCRVDIVVPPGWRGKPLNVPVSCPPSVIREVLNDEDIAPYSSNTSLLPTDGLPVKNIHHRVPGHKAKEPRDCEACGEEIARFLTKTLDVTGPDTSNTTDAGAAEDRQFPTLQWKDILILFERDVKENLSILKPLKKSGFQVQVIDSINAKNVLKNNNNTVLAAKAGFSCGLKRKVVVYVEGDIDRSESSAKWNRLFGVTTCTSQLVFVRMT